jgi:hypothetical protein
MRLLQGAHRAYRQPGRDLRRQGSVAVIALYGFLNRFNHTLATELEASPLAAGKRFVAERGWTVGKHAR